MVQMLVCVIISSFTIVYVDHIRHGATFHWNSCYLAVTCGLLTAASFVMYIPLSEVFVLAVPFAIIDYFVIRHLSLLAAVLNYAFHWFVHGFRQTELGRLFGSRVPLSI